MPYFSCKHRQTCSIFIVIHDIFSDVVIIVVIGKHALIFVHSFPSHDYKSHHENDNHENYNRTRKDKLLPLVACKKKDKELILILQFCYYQVTILLSSQYDSSKVLLQNKLHFSTTSKPVVNQLRFEKRFYAEVQIMGINGKNFHCLVSGI